VFSNVFFFSSRRRHTRSKRDWSSDVCSSDLAADEGTDRMKEIGKAVQEGASAYLTRQFKTLGIFALIAFALLFVLPGDANVRIGRSIFFLFGAGFSAVIGYMGMWLAVRANE